MLASWTLELKRSYR